MLTLFSLQSWLKRLKVNRVVHPVYKMHKPMGGCFAQAGSVPESSWSAMSILYLANCLVLASGTEAESSIAGVNTPGMIIL